MEYIIRITYMKDDKTDCSNYRAYQICQLSNSFIPHPSVKIKSACRGNYSGSSMWNSTQHFNYWSYILHSSNS